MTLKTGNLSLPGPQAFVYSILASDGKIALHYSKMGCLGQQLMQSRQCLAALISNLQSHVILLHNRPAPLATIAGQQSAADASM